MASDKLPTSSRAHPEFSSTDIDPATGTLEVAASMCCVQPSGVAQRRPLSLLRALGDLLLVGGVF
jgi:hypothetical protein